MTDASTRGRRNRANGNAAEAAVARWLRPWYPDACRAVRNTVPDPGDLDCTAPGLYWSIKNTQQDRIGPWMAELDAKRDDRIGLLVVRRRGHASPGAWWCHMRLHTLADLTGGMIQSEDARSAVARIELRDVMDLLVQACYARRPTERRAS